MSRKPKAPKKWHRRLSKHPRIKTYEQAMADLTTEEAQRERLIKKWRKHDGERAHWDAMML